MKNTIITLSAVGLVALLFVWDSCYWHIFGLHYSQSPKLLGTMFWLGLLSSVIAGAFAGFGLRKSAFPFFRFVWCLAVLMSYCGFYAYCIHHVPSDFQ
jgi:hypothetical protein